MLLRGGDGKGILRVCRKYWNGNPGRIVLDKSIHSGLKVAFSFSLFHPAWFIFALHVDQRHETAIARVGLVQKPFPSVRSTLLQKVETQPAPTYPNEPYWTHCKYLVNAKNL